VRVVVDALAATTGGGVTYLRSILASALAADPELELVVVAANAAPFAELVAGGRTRVETPLGSRPSLPRRVAWESTALGRLASRAGGDVLFCPSELAPFGTPVPVVLGLQNPNLYERPVPYAATRQELRLRTLALAARSSARRAAALVFVSEPFRDRTAPHLASPAPTFVAEPALDPVFDHPLAGDGSAVPGPYVLAVSDFYPYKNFPLLVEAFALLKRPGLRLVLAGRPVDLHSYRLTLDRAAALGVESQMTVLGSVPLAEMPALYRGAECLAFPSLLESYGFPPLEAMACGVPVVSSDASVMPGVLGDAAAYADARSAPALAAAIEQVLGDPAYANALRERGRGRVARLDRAAAGRALVTAFAAGSSSRPAQGAGRGPRRRAS
jgi:glycosyltransferase involved in cell wall biosynthesis